MAETEVKKCQNCKAEFTIEPEDFDFYARMKVPAPTFCPECRLIRRLGWRNESSLYKRKCNVPGHEEDVISMFSEDKPVIVYDQRYWWSDAWGQIEKSGKEYDFSRPFFEQFKELLQEAPMPSLSTNYPTMINSEYSNWSGDLKNCYLVFDSDFIEDSAYGSGLVHCKDCLDNDFIRQSEMCYFGFDLEKCYKAVCSASCKDSDNIFFCKDCVGVSNCFGCVNLRNKKYHIFNKPYSKEDYERKLQEFGVSSYENFVRAKGKAKDFWKQFPKRSYRGLHNTDVTGDYVYHSKNVKQGFLITDVEDSKFIALTHSKPTKDCYDYADWGDNVQ